MKKNGKRWMTAVGAVVVAGGGIVAGVSGDAVIVIRNESGGVLADVEIGGDGGELEFWTQSLPDVAAGETVSSRITESHGESGLRIRVVMDGAEAEKSDIAYLMNGGQGTTTEVVVYQGGRVEAHHESWPSWHWRRLF